MKKFSKKSGLLFVAAMAVCAFAMPSMASASSWGVINSHHVLDSPNIGFTTANVTSSCSSSSFTARVDSAQVLTITTASFGGCTASGAVGTCTATSRGTGFPWIATAVSTSNIQIHNVHIDVLFEGGASCTGNGLSTTLEGTVTGGEWTGNGANQHEVLLAHDGGLTSTSALGAQAAFATGTVRDTQQTLTVTG